MNEPYIDSLESYSDIAMILPLILVLKIHLNHTCNGSCKIGGILRLSDHATPTHQAHQTSIWVSVFLKHTKI